MSKKRVGQKGVVGAQPTTMGEIVACEEMR